MKAISCKYLPATRFSPARVKAYDLDGNSAVVECEGNRDDIRAAKALCAKMNWKGKLTCGHTKEGTVFVWFADSLGFVGETIEV
jgi:hypothetical protein